MAVHSRREYLAVVTLIGLWWAFSAAAQPGFLSIDCGGSTNRTDPQTDIQWVTDDNFIDTGNKTELNRSVSPFYFQSLRVFPKPLSKSCYRLPLTPHVPHLLRIWFGGGYFPIENHRNFKYSIETKDMLSLRTPSLPQQPSEKILVSSGSLLHVCLIRSSPFDDPFISAIELRTLLQGMYSQAKPTTMLHYSSRYDFGNGSSIVRYPQDPFDRIWVPGAIEGPQTMSSSNPISTNGMENHPPSVVMQTAQATEENGINVTSNQLVDNPLFLLYLADIEQRNGSESRIVGVDINGADTDKVVHVNYLSAVQLTFSLRTPFSWCLIFKAPNSLLGPIINAFELYERLPTEPATSRDDAAALSDIKQSFNITSWVSDPCFGVPWDGIQCNSSSSTVRVSEIDLSGKNLVGSIPPATLGRLTALVNISIDNNHLTGGFPNLSNVTKLERLHLQNNNLSGKVPDWLSKLQHLKELFIQNNSFSGVIPQQLLDNRSLRLKYDDNRYLCMNGACRRSSNSTISIHSKDKVGMVVGITAGVVVLVALVFFMGIIQYRKKFRKEETTSSKSGIRSKKSRHLHGQDFSMVLVPNPSKSRAFTLDEMMTATENFTHKIGQGGFGSVFLGVLDEGKQIAVKVLSYFSKQGVVEFLNEIDLLSRVHHRNLVSLLGYCNESRELMLVYEYMPGGSLKDHLYGPKSGEYPNLDWKTRLKISLDAAQGMEYLHVNCTPKIIHRDVKTANFLLDSNFNGKLADFGLSRVTIEEEKSHVTTTVKGTAGYLDPEYFQTQMLTEKSDIYSFGVVLLEIICGRRPIDAKLSEDEINLIRWVTPYVDRDDPNKITEIVDKRLGAEFDPKSVIHVARLALRCVAAEPSSRPSINEVVIEMKEAIKYENEAALSFHALEHTLTEDDDLQSSQISLSDNSGPKETISSGNSPTCRSKGIS